MRATTHKLGELQIEAIKVEMARAKVRGGRALAAYRSFYHKLLTDHSDLTEAEIDRIVK